MHIFSTLLGDIKHLRDVDLLGSGKLSRPNVTRDSGKEISFSHAISFSYSILDFPSQKSILNMNEFRAHGEKVFASVDQILIDSGLKVQIAKITERASEEMLKLGVPSRPSLGLIDSLPFS